MNARSAALATLLMLMPVPSSPAATESAGPAPAFTHVAAEDWLNSPPLSLEQLRGQPVLIEFWTFACWNCERSIAFMQDLQRRLGPRGLRIISVHTPELAQEKVRANVVAAVKQRNITYPVMIDGDYSYWNALDNEYWPAFYLVDRQGRLRGAVAGETHVGDGQALAIEQALLALLAEPAP